MGEKKGGGLRVDSEASMDEVWRLVIRNGAKSRGYGKEVCEQGG